MNKKVELHINPQRYTLTLRKQEERQLVFVVTVAPQESVKLECILQGEGAALDILGIIMLDSLQSLRCDINVVHAAEYTTSRVILASVLKNMACQEVNGKIVIQKGARGADGFLSHRTLTLGASAKSISVPTLEIEEEDVKAGHEGVTGPVDEQELFYLQTRGLDRMHASTLVVEGFLGSAIEKIEDKEIKEKMKQHLISAYVI